MLGITDFVFWIYILCIFAGIVLMHFVGSAFGLYKKIRFYDLIEHFISGCFLYSPLGFFIAGLFIDGHSVANRLGVAIFAFCFGGAACAFWEIFEFTVDSIFKTNMQRWKDGTKYSQRGSGLVDTMTDLIANFIGSCIGCTILALLGIFVFYR